MPAIEPKTYNQLCAEQRAAYSAWQSAPAGQGDAALEQYLICSHNLEQAQKKSEATQ